MTLFVSCAFSLTYANSPSHTPSSSLPGNPPLNENGSQDW